MQTLLVMTILGEDRTGLVDSVAALVAKHGGNWLESRMSRLGGHFAGILRVQVPAAHEEALVQSLRDLQAQGLTVVVHGDRAPAASAPQALRTIEIVGQDRPGIVRDISAALARHHVNVEELNTECSSAAMSGEMVFTARATVGIPAGCDMAALRSELEKIAQDLIVEIAFAEVSVPQG